MPTLNNEESRLFLSKVHLKGFKSIEDVSVDFKKGLNILIGKNGSGKSNFLECMNHVLTNIGGESASYKFAEIELQSSDKNYFVWETEKVSKRIQAENENFEEHPKIKEKLLINGIESYNNFSSEKYADSLIFNYKNIVIPRGSARGILRKIGYPLIIPLFIKFNLPNNLECISVVGDIFIQLNEGELDFWDNPETLKFLRILFYNLENSFGDEIGKLIKINRELILKELKIPVKIKENLKKYSPIKDVRFNENINIYKDDKIIRIENLKIEFKINGYWMPWSQLSDGTRRLFYIISEVTDQESGFVLLEEPELGIHPHQFHLLMQFLKEESENMQIIVSTHSPQALNFLSEDELSNILIAYYDLKKATQIRHLTDAQINKAKKYMTEVGFLSDYWTLSDLES